MHKRRFAAATALLVSTASLTAITASPASATSAAVIYVDNTSAACSNSGTGTAAAPFCTIQAAANVAGPGQTVLIGGSNDLTPYVENVVVKHSGTASAPITFAAADRYYNVVDYLGSAFNLTGVSNVVISGLFASGLSDTITVSNSSNITIENSRVELGGAPVPSPLPVGVHVTDHSSAVTVEKSWFSGQDSNEILVDGGSTETVVATNIIYTDAYDTAIAVSGASGTDITGNTVVGERTCSSGISVTGASTSTSVENNAVTDLSNPGNICSFGAPTDLIVSADSAATTNAQYNVFTTYIGGVTPYNWAGKTYTTAADFQTATHKGAQDIVPSTLDLTIKSFPAASPLIDSADANAPGETSTDIYGNARVDDPTVPNTGTGVGYYDRGAVEYQEYTSSSLAISADTPQYIEAHVRLKGVAWGFWPTVTFDWGDGTTSTSEINPVEDSPAAADFTDYFLGQHLYAMRGQHVVTATLTDLSGSKIMTQTVTTTGDTYTPVNPTRVLDTRHGIGWGGPTSGVPANTSVAFDPTAGVSGAPAANLIRAVVLNVTVTGPANGGYVTAYPDGTTRPASSNLNFSPGQTVPNLVTVKIGADGKVALFNGSGGNAHLIADVEGYYIASTAGDGYVPVSPARLLDTRNGTGTGGSTSPVAAGHTLSLKVEGASPVAASGVTAVALNVTVTQPAASGYISVYPGSTTQPQSSNLNFSANETVANMVIVPVGKDGTVNLTNGSTGTTALVADVFGYYVATGTGGHAFIPTDPARVVDTRSVGGAPMPPNSDVHVSPNGNGESGQAYFHTALVLNVTVTQPTAGGYISARTQGAPLPTVSNVNFSAGETVPNLVITPSADLGLDTLLRNNSSGTVELIADMFGYFS